MRKWIFALFVVSWSAPVLAKAPTKIALIQYHEVFGQTQTNIDRLTAYAETAIRNGAKMVVFPEGTLFGYDSGREIWCLPGMRDYTNDEGTYRRCRNVAQVAEPIPLGSTIQHWRQFAMNNQIYVVFTIIEVSRNRYYNTLVTADPHGAVTKYRKRKLYHTDKAYASKGRESAVLQTPFGRFGLLICVEGIDTDIPVFDESLDFGFYNAYKAMGANAILIPMNWGAWDTDDPLAAKNVFENRARHFSIEIFASDAYDGTARYFTDGRSRDRGGLPAPIRSEGISYHQIAF